MSFGVILATNSTNMKTILTVRSSVTLTYIQLLQPDASSPTEYEQSTALIHELCHNLHFLKPNPLTFFFCWCIIECEIIPHNLNICCN